MLICLKIYFKSGRHIVCYSSMSCWGSANSLSVILQKQVFGNQLEVTRYKVCLDSWVTEETCLIMKYGLA